MNAFPSVFLPVFPSSHNPPSILPKAHHSLIFLTKICRRLAAIFLLCSLSQTGFLSLGFPLPVHRYPIWYPSSPDIVPSKCGTLLKDYQQVLGRIVSAAFAAPPGLAFAPRSRSIKTRTTKRSYTGSRGTWPCRSGYQQRLQRLSASAAFYDLHSSLGLQQHRQRPLGLAG